MAHKEPNLPFRWDISGGDRTGSLTDGIDYEPGYVDALAECAAKVLARSADGDLYFVGRSPDSVYDLLSGVLADTGHRERLHRLPLSLYGFDGEEVTPDERAQLRTNLTASGISPRSLAARERPVVFADLVLHGSTFGNLHRELRDWIDDERVSWNLIRRRLRYLGITVREKTSPNTWRWQQHAEWTSDLQPSAVRNVSIDRFLWGHLGNSQPKTEHSFRRSRWSDPSVTRPRHDEKARRGLAEALSIHAHGRTRRVRSLVHRTLTAEPAFRDPWLRTLAHGLRASGGTFRP
ncbi:MAG: hypothetical protein JK586_14250 [Nocardiopsis sp. BM-2018]|uniref:Uncharacterized protein n=1 Tax=Nocardiopsis metallicus TaxID=179819 RepID=A0A840VY17_9ACTN|nr:hypothetical protein [Nocardiopsis metallicus]MBB5489289.1 hypothetical protein [Nocardiopsis metallicus]QRN79431.1 MAG: hypothetical protein JK586_14250 [Nocardiopsis sp. BM-2018]